MLQLAKDVLIYETNQKIKELIGFVEKIQAHFQKLDAPCFLCEGIKT
jgi:hypothetical protein